MKTAIRKIDRAIKTLNNVEHDHKAEDFIVREPEAVGQIDPAGALYIREEKDAHQEGVAVGIYFHPQVARELGSFRRWEMDNLTLPQKRAFAVASEEVSHFNYLLRQVHSGRAVSRFEMELQGEVDVFLVTFFATTGQGRELEAFDTAFRQAFEAFGLVDGLSSDEKDRYREANQGARRFLHKLREDLCHPDTRAEALRRIRQFYRLGLADKMALIAA
jgi:hypothetical protein